MWDGFTFAFRKETMIIGKGGGVIYQHSKRFSVRQGPHYTATGNQPQEPLNQQTTNGRIGGHGHGEVAPGRGRPDLAETKRGRKSILDRHVHTW